MFGLGLLPTLLGVGALVAMLGGGYVYVHHAGFSEGSAAQIALDEPKIAAANKRIGMAESSLATSQSDLDSCSKGVEKRTTADKHFEDIAKAAQAVARAEANRRMIDGAKADAKIAELQKLAAAKPKLDQTCADTAKKTDAILTEQLRSRRTK